MLNRVTQNSHRPGHSASRWSTGFSSNAPSPSSTAAPDCTDGSTRSTSTTYEDFSRCSSNVLPKTMTTRDMATIARTMPVRPLFRSTTSSSQCGCLPPRILPVKRVGRGSLNGSLFFVAGRSRVQEVTVCSHTIDPDQYTSTSGPSPSTEGFRSTSTPTSSERMRGFPLRHSSFRYVFPPVVTTRM